MTVTTKLEQLDQVIAALEILQKRFLPLLSAAGNISEARGRRCILAIADKGKTHRQYYFEVTQTGIQLVDAYAVYNTLIQAPLDGVLRVFTGLLYGWESAFSNEWTRGEARVIGERSMHDAIMFSNTFRQLARLIRKVAGETRCPVCGNRFAKDIPCCLQCGQDFPQRGPA